MQRRFRRILTTLREQTCVSYAKIATAGGFCDVDLIIIKATAPDDLPLLDRYVQELLKIFSLSPSSFRAFSLSFTRRFGKTHCWRVALKCLLLLHRLLRSVPEDSRFRSELLWARANGLISLNPCHFRDTSSSFAKDYTMFIKSYAQLLDEALDCIAFDSINYDDDDHDEGEQLPDSLSGKMKEVSRLIEILPQLQSLIDRVMDCRPTLQASKNYIIKAAMKRIIRDSFTCYTSFRSEIIVVLDNLFQMPYRNCISAFGIYKKAAVQANHLSEFYEWCKVTGLCGSYEYPFIEKIPQIHIRALETFLNGMWQLTESSESTQSGPSSLVGSPSSMNDDYDVDGQSGNMAVVVSTKWERFEEDENNGMGKKFEDIEREPLIQLEVNESVSWEALLEHSISFSQATPPPTNFRQNGGYTGHQYGHEHGGYEINVERERNEEKEREGWKLQVYNPYSSSSNPFHQPAAYYNTTPSHNGFYASNPAYPWGL